MDILYLFIYYFEELFMFDTLSPHLGWSNQYQIRFISFLNQSKILTMEAHGFVIDSSLILVQSRAKIANGMIALGPLRM